MLIFNHEENYIDYDWLIDILTRGNHLFLLLLDINVRLVEIHQIA